MIKSLLILAIGLLLVSKCTAQAVKAGLLNSNQLNLNLQLNQNLQSNSVIQSAVLNNSDLVYKPLKAAQLALQKNDLKSFVANQNAFELKTWAANLAADLPYNDDLKLRSLLGAQFDNSDPNILKSVPADSARLLASLPLTYDLRSARPSCWSIGYIRHQGQCGSCWAVAGSTSLSDRYCFKKPLLWFLTVISMKRSFSYQDPLECCSLATCGTGPNKGCNGGKISGAFAYAVQTGIPTGENFGNTTNCKNYFLSPSAAPAAAPSCRAYCPTSGYATTITNDRYKIAGYNVYTIGALGQTGVVNAMMSAIYNRGTIVAYMDVYNDFYAYSTGVYSKTATAVFKGGHAVRLIGWGANIVISSWIFKVTLGAYWIGANSWGTSWGINGFFYIKKGSNECNIEYYAVEGNL